MRSDDLFLEDDPFADFTVRREVNEDLLAAIRTGPIQEAGDIDVAIAVARLAHDQFEAFGTDSSHDLTEAQSRQVIAALLAVTARVDCADFSVPFRGFGTFRSWWLKNNASGSWQARRDLLQEFFDPLHDRLSDMELSALRSTLAEPVSPHARTGWDGVDAEVSELRRHFQRARTPQDYRAVGLLCVSVTEAISRHAYDRSRHLRVGEEEPAVANTKQRLDRVVEDAATGSNMAAVRKLARASIELAQHVKHSDTPTRREAGIAADAVIQLANMIRRLAEEF